MLAVLFAASITGAQPPPRPLAVAAASDLQAALPVIAAQFEKEAGVKVNVTFGSSGNFFAQIQNGAPFDVFLSADLEYPRQLVQAGLAERDSVYEYATGRLVVWARNDSGIDVRRGLPMLADASVRRIAIANPAHAPYGRAAVAAMRHAGVYDRAQPKLVLGENISQAAQFAQSGNAQAGILALSLALAPALKTVGSYVEIPATFHPPIDQAAVVVSGSAQKRLAHQFLEALKRPEAQRVLQSYGFAPPQRVRPGV